MISVFFVDGLERLGLMGWPLLLTSVVALAVMAERAFFFFVHRPRRDLVRHRLDTHLDAGHAGAAQASLAKLRSPLAQLASAYLESAPAGAQTQRACAQQRFRGWLARARGPVRTLGMIAQVAPLLGLTGTVLGLVDTFQVVQAHPQAVDPALLAGGIWEALLTTIVGMLISVPVIVLIRCFNSRIELTSRLADDLFLSLQMKHPAAAKSADTIPMQAVS